jgi:hypothetical protein
MRSQRAVPVLCMRAVKAAGPFWMLCLECTCWMRCVRCMRYMHVPHVYVHASMHVRTYVPQSTLRACRLPDRYMPDARTRICHAWMGCHYLRIWTATDCTMNVDALRYVQCVTWKYRYLHAIHARITCDARTFVTCSRSIHYAVTYVRTWECVHFAAAAARNTYNYLIKLHLNRYMPR